jgi:VCBS repeat protein
MLHLITWLSATLQGPAAGSVPASPTLRLADPISYFAPTSWIWFAASGEMGRVVRDLNNDGSPDVVFAFGGIYATPPELRTWLGDGEGGFSTGSASPLLASPVYFQGGDRPFAVEDFDLDGVLDVALSLGVSLSGSQVLRGDGLGGFLPWLGPLALAQGYYAAGDIDSDGDADIAITVPPQGPGGYTVGMSYAFNQGGAGFGGPPGPCTSLTWTAGAYATQTELRDLNNDSIVDYVGCGDVFQILSGFGNGCFANATSAIYWITVSPPANYKTYAWGDFNGDGADDLVLLTSVSGTVMNPIHVAVYLRASPTSSTWNLGPTFANPGWPTGVAAGDLDQDGYADFVVTEVASPINYSATGNRARVYRNLGGGTAFQATPHSEGYTWLVSSPTLTDVDGDGDPDLLVNQRGQVSVTPPSFAVAINTSGGSDIEVIGRPQIGRTVRLDLEGTAGANWTLLASPATGPSLSFPGFQGTLGLDLASLFVAASGVFPSDGNALVPVTIPNIPGLVGGIVNLQYVAVVPGSPPGWFSGITTVTIQ